jgi:CRISPR-associated protein (TIGR03984 family)
MNQPLITTFDSLDEQLLSDYLAKVSPQGHGAWCYLLEPSFIGFGWVDSKGVSWPEHISPAWERVEDLRLFGDLGELHIWQRWDGRWQGRLWEAPTGSKDVAAQGFEQRYVLWGNRFDDQKSSMTEGRGASLSFPPQKLQQLNNDSLPLKMEIWHCVDYDQETGLAGIVDSAWRGFRSKDETTNPLPF